VAGLIIICGLNLKYLAFGSGPLLFIYYFYSLLSSDQAVFNVRPCFQQRNGLRSFRPASKKTTNHEMILFYAIGTLLFHKKSFHHSSTEHWKLNLLYISSNFRGHRTIIGSHNSQTICFDDGWVIHSVGERWEALNMTITSMPPSALQLQFVWLVLWKIL
jgi:hypothetical protein